jgi:hypothetical protein
MATKAHVDAKLIINLKLTKRRRFWIDVIVQARRRGLVVVGDPAPALRWLIDYRPRLVTCKREVTVTRSTLQPGVRLIVTSLGKTLSDKGPSE